MGVGLLDYVLFIYDEKVCLFLDLKKMIPLIDFGKYKQEKGN